MVDLQPLGPFNVWDNCLLWPAGNPAFVIGMKLQGTELNWLYCIYFATQK